MDRFPLISGMIMGLFVFLISTFYLLFRLSAREDQLKNLFKLEGILIPYLNSRGCDTAPPKAAELMTADEKKDYLKKLRENFDAIYEIELSREYGRLQYIFASLAASSSSGIVIYYICSSSIGRFLIRDAAVIPSSTLEFALLGSFAWSMWLLLSSYDRLDLVPSTFYWIPFRYIVGIVVGLIASSIIGNNRGAMAFVLVSTAIPYPELLNSLRTLVPKLGRVEVGGPSLFKIQGMQEETVYRLQQIGISTTQELAYFDPLTLLFRTSFSPKVVIDWIDQSLAYNYVGDSMNELRKRGIRGSIEIRHAKGNTNYIGDMARVLNITSAEVEYLIAKLDDDYQVQLLSKIWDVFR